MIEIFDAIECVAGDKAFVESTSLDGSSTVVFEEDDDTGYLYAVDPLRSEQSIQDALFIYNVEVVRGAKVTIGWAHDSKSVIVLVDDHPQAVFDFASRRGYCRSGFPPPDADGAWASHDYHWTDDALAPFLQGNRLR